MSDIARFGNLPVDKMLGSSSGERDNKTIINSFLCADIVEYSKDTVAGQIGLKEYFNTVLAGAISDVPVQNRIILDTGDGAVISFLGEVEDALRTALNIRSSLLDAGVDVPLQIRMGINLGPVRLVKDINGHPNIVGDGINVAQRLMAFANESQILVSRSYYEAVSRLSPEYADLFRHIGLLTDKHVRTHDVYAVLGRQREISTAREKLATATMAENGRGKGRKINNWIKLVWDTYKSASVLQRALYVGVSAGGLSLLIVMAVYLRQQPKQVQPAIAAEEPVLQTAAITAVSAVAPASFAVSAVSPSAVAKLPAEKSARQAPQPAPSRTPPPEQRIISSALKSPPKTPVSQVQVPVALVKSVALSQPVAEAATASVSFAVTPWGEIHLNGKMMGISPPLTELQIAPGVHEIKILNTSFPAYTQQVRVKANVKIKIKHKFVN
jgi:class 3 adenylate cyclase